MSLVIATPELMAEAATHLEAIGSALDEAHLTAAGPTGTVAPAAADEVSVGIAQLFSGFGQEYQVLARQTAQFHEDFVQHLNASAGMYAGAEAINVGLLQPLISSVESFLVTSGYGPLLFSFLSVLEIALAALLAVLFVSYFIFALFAFGGTLALASQFAMPLAPFASYGETLLLTLLTIPFRLLTAIA
ncbi:PE family protein [Mycobacterium bourgelatii]|uniref:PE domain-containing protein n=1 Tax=Mycobacterium bourgelatii TaxID=1273442 RepID=A0A7I9YVQ5_MYCBU|nr:PE family protein [Mycobacterium bourgelatii]MCV6976266.1 PE family protein [Mycobacterium bourgelatii]GFG92657.1 hypothetical protein MBOU_46990 [Mycobacterium bourgelatii]